MPAAPSTVDAIVLAGGLGRRMGGEKGLHILGGRPLIAHVVACVAPQVARLALNANANAAVPDYAAFGLPLVADTFAGRPGPLAGVLAGLEWMSAAPSAWLLSVPCDAPFLPHDLVQRLLSVVGTAEIACAASGNQLHPVCALWRHDLGPALRAALAAGARGVEDFVRSRRLAVADFAGEPDPFFNVNTAADLARAESLLG